MCFYAIAFVYNITSILGFVLITYSMEQVFLPPAEQVFLPGGTGVPPYLQQKPPFRVVFCKPASQSKLCRTGGSDVSILPCWWQSETSCTGWELLIPVYSWVFHHVPHCLFLRFRIHQFCFREAVLFTVAVEG